MKVKPIVPAETKHTRPVRKMEGFTSTCIGSLVGCVNNAAPQKRNLRAITETSHTPSIAFVSASVCTGYAGTCSVEQSTGNQGRNAWGSCLAKEQTKIHARDDNQHVFLGAFLVSAKQSTTGCEPRPGRWHPEPGGHLSPKLLP